MKDIIEIPFLDSSEGAKELKDGIIELFESVKNQGFWDKSIIRIIITDDFLSEINKQKEPWDIDYSISSGKDYTVVSKVLFNQDIDSPQNIILVSFDLLQKNMKYFFEVSVNQILNIKAKNLFSKKVLGNLKGKILHSLNDYVTYSSLDWICSYDVDLRYSNRFNRETPILDHNAVLTKFKRSLKRNLFEYNSDKGDEKSKITSFWHNYYSSFHELFLRISENETEQENLLIKGKEGILIYEVLNEIKALRQTLINNGEFNIESLKEKIKVFSEHYEITLNEKDNKIDIKLTKNPKDYFPGLVDTEPRIVCFLDILGFKNFITKYETDTSSTVLQDIQGAFVEARKDLIHTATKLSNYDEEIEKAFNDALQKIEHQTFSDNICISLPYFDREDDFLFSFYLLSTYTLSFQAKMMAKGFFMRGGIALGSFYSDKNIIFSEGLVKAYELESKLAVYPRIILSTEIVNRLLVYTFDKIKSTNLGRVVIFDWEGHAFLNPFGTLDSSYQIFDTLKNEMQSDIDKTKDDDFFKSLNKFENEILSPFLDFISKEVKRTRQNQIVEIKNYLNQYLQENTNNSHVFSKYLWFQELIKWLEKDEGGQLKFSFLEDKITDC